jgi:5'(3')-deoxyribonucleotidase
MMNELPKIYCDMDQVLVNLLGGANRALQMQGLPDFTKAPKDVKWEALKQVPKFWANLDPMPDGMMLWRFIRQYDAAILSTPSKRMPTCESEKREWIRKHLGNVRDVNIVPRDDKQKFAVTKDGKPNILIDDYKKNIDEWEAKGGIGIRHINTMQTLSQLRKLGF